MSLKKRLFRSHLAILFLALVALLVIVFLLLLFFEDSLEIQFRQAGRDMLQEYGIRESTVPDDWTSLLLQNSFSTLAAVFFLTGAGAIAVILLLAAVFTRRMNRLVMEPLDALVQGANRIREGNLQEEISYYGEEEFENVCRTFNDMQKTILENQEQRARDERARRDMVTGISHDLRTPLTSVQGYIKGVLDQVADTPEKQYLTTAYESTKEMNVLLQKLFDFSRMESGQMPFHMVRADLAEFAEGWTVQREAAVGRERVRFLFRRDAEVMPEISMDVELPVR